MAWLSEFHGRGSTLDVPVREMPDYYRRLGAPPGITDVILLTDAQCRIPEETRIHFLNWKAASRARVVSLVINNPPGDLAFVSDEVHTVPALAADGEAVGRVLSL